MIRKNDSIEARREAGRSMVRAFHEDVFAEDRSETLALETRITRAFDEETAYLGILDRVAKTPEGIVRIVDFKTGKTVPSELDDETAEQLRSYGWLYMSEHGADSVELRYRYLVDGSQLAEHMPAHAAAAVEERIRERIRAAPRPGRLSGESIGPLRLVRLPRHLRRVGLLRGRNGLPPAAEGRCDGARDASASSSAAPPSPSAATRATREDLPRHGPDHRLRLRGPTAREGLAPPPRPRPKPPARPLRSRIP